METKEVRRLFERAAQKEHVCDSNQWACDVLQYEGIKKFVDEIFGWKFWKKEKNISLDQLAKILINLGIADDLRDGKSKVFSIADVQLNYGNF